MDPAAYRTLARATIARHGPLAHPLAPAPAPPPPAADPLACRHRGPPTGESRPWVSCHRDPPTRIPLLACAVHGACTVDRGARGAACCRVCPDRLPPPAAPFEWVPTARLAADAVLLAGRVPPGASGVAGVPRSGMVPAAVVAAHLHLPLWELSRAGELRELGAGSRGPTLYRPAGPLVVVDDTVYAGDAMRRARAAMGALGRPALFAAVYARPEARRAVDLCARELPGPHLLEWNLFNNGPFVGSGARAFGAGVAVDLDGVIVHDAASGGRPGDPYLVPRRAPCRLIATGRPEAHRAATEAALTRLGVRWAKLAMYPGDRTPADPLEVAAFKAGHFAASACGFYVESDPAQAAEIFRLARKPVVCPILAKVFQ